MSEIKQQLTLEEAAQEYANAQGDNYDAAYYGNGGFVAGAEWQKEQDKEKVYTLKDMEAAFEAGKTYGDTDACFRFTDSVSRKEWEETPDFSQFIKEYQHDTQNTN